MHTKFFFSLVLFCIAVTTLSAQSFLGVTSGIEKTDFHEPKGRFLNYTELIETAYPVGIIYQKQTQNKSWNRFSASLIYSERNSVVSFTPRPGHIYDVVTSVDYGSLSFSGKIGTSLWNERKVSPYFDFGLYFGVPVHGTVKTNLDFTDPAFITAGEYVFEQEHKLSEFLKSPETGFMADIGVIVRLSDQYQFFVESDISYSFSASRVRYAKQWSHLGVKAGFLYRL